MLYEQLYLGNFIPSSGFKKPQFKTLIFTFILNCERVNMFFQSWFFKVDKGMKIPECNLNNSKFTELSK